MKKLYFDITSGISGDIMLSSLLSFGLDIKELSRILSSALGKSVKLSLEQVWRNSILCNRLVIDCDIEGEPYRYLADIKELISKSECSDTVKEKAIESFVTLALAESHVHGISIDEVHFHEIGAVDTIIDILGVSWAIEQLRVSKIYSSYPVLGYGVIDSAHGRIPLPAPAVVKILDGIECTRINVEGELTTPTGAVLLKTHVNEFTNSFSGKVIKDTFSTGSKEYLNIPNSLRTILLEESLNFKSVIKIETNIDDMTGENLAYLYEKLMSADALDVCFIPIFAKKNRPAYMVSVMAEKNNLSNIADTVFKYSSTGGIRVEDVKRIEAEKEFIEKTVFGEKVNVKVIKYNGNMQYSPEWEDCKKVAEKHNISVKNVMDEVIKSL